LITDGTRSDWRPSLRTAFGVHGAATAATQFVTQTPLAAALVGGIGAFFLLQLAVLAACTWHVPRTVR
jgi:hypothetical protein